MKDGRIVEAGRHAELVSNGGKYAELYATHA
jgi:ABC-type transport system involved in Fe-S cluster assembly fused permease/ATPase subunit